MQTIDAEREKKENKNSFLMSHLIQILIINRKGKHTGETCFHVKDGIIFENTKPKYMFPSYQYSVEIAQIKYQLFRVRLSPVNPIHIMN